MTPQVSEQLVLLSVVCSTIAFNPHITPACN